MNITDWKDVAQLGLSVFLTLWLILKSGPAERREAAATLKAALAEARADYEKWQNLTTAATTKLVEVISNVQAKVIHDIQESIKNSLTSNSQSLARSEDIVKEVNRKFDEVKKEIFAIREEYASKRTRT